jgi:hypothetical protein
MEKWGWEKRLADGAAAAVVAAGGTSLGSELGTQSAWGRERKRWVLVQQRAKKGSHEESVEKDMGRSGGRTQTEQEKVKPIPRRRGPQDPSDHRKQTDPTAALCCETYDDE